MKPIVINFAAPGVAPALFRLHPALRAAALLGALLCLSAAVAAYQAAQARSVRAVLQAEQRSRSQRAAAPAPSLIPALQTAAVNRAILQLNLPWRAVHDALAAATPAGVALLTLEPDAGKQLLKLTAETRSSDEMIAFIERMKAQAGFKAVLLTRHEVNQQDPQQPIRFQIEAHWTDL